MNIPEICDVSIVFGTTEGLPDYQSVPQEFKRHNGTPWNGLVSKIFFGGIKGLQFTPQEGIDASKAWRHIKALLVSFEPKHEHKEAGCAYLMSQYFKSAKWDGGEIK